MRRGSIQLSGGACMGLTQIRFQRGRDDVEYASAGDGEQEPDAILLIYTRAMQGLGMRDGQMH